MQDIYYVFLKVQIFREGQNNLKKSPCCQRFYLKHLILKSYILKIIDLYRQERLFHFQISWGRTRRTFRHRTFLSGRRTITLLFVLAVSMKIYNTYTRKLSNILVAKVLHTKVNKLELNWLLVTKNVNYLYWCQPNLRKFWEFDSESNKKKS